MPDVVVQLLALAGLVVLGTLTGMVPMRRFIRIREAKHELKQGSASQLRELAGWFVILLWLAALWFGGTVIGDWIRLADFDAALERSLLRLRFLVELLAALAD